MKKILVIIYIIDILFICLDTKIIMWWYETHNEPGLADKLSVDPFIVYLIVALIIFASITVYLIKNKKK